MSDIEIYDPPLGGLVDVKVHGYYAASNSYLVRIESEAHPTLVPAKDVHVEAPSDFDDYNDDEELFSSGSN